MIIKVLNLFNFAVYLIFVNILASQNLACDLPHSTKTANCVKTSDCDLLKSLTDFTDPDAFEELQQRQANCQHAGPKMICCESNHIQPTVAIASNNSPQPLEVNTLLSPTTHKNYKLFDFKSCGKAGSTNRVANGESLTKFKKNYLISPLQFTCLKVIHFFLCYT